MADWKKVENEYINGDISYRKLAEKHGISFASLQQKARKDRWKEKRDKQRERIQTKALQKTADILAKAEADRLVRISDAADRLLTKIEEAMEQLDQFIVTQKVRQREIKYEENKAGFGKPKKEIVKEAESRDIVHSDYIDKAGLKQLTSALKDLRDIQFTAKEEERQEKPTITINVMEATAEDVEED